MRHTLLAALALVAFLVAPRADAQVDWYQEMLNSTVLQGDTWFQYPNNTFYVAVNGAPSKGVGDDGTLGNGSYVVGADGEVTDCAVSPAECMELLEEAADSGEPTVTSQNPPEGGDAETLDDSESALFRQFEVTRNGSVRFSRRGGLAGVQGRRLHQSWIDKAKRRQLRLRPRGR